MECPKCAEKITKEWLSKEGFCPNCGAKLKTRKGELITTVPTSKKQKPTAAWYLAPVLMGLLGGILGYMGVQERDKKMAKRLLLIGILVTAIGAVIGVLLLYFGLIKFG